MNPLPFGLSIFAPVWVGRGRSHAPPLRLQVRCSRRVAFVVCLFSAYLSALPGPWSASKAAPSKFLAAVLYIGLPHSGHGVPSVWRARSIRRCFWCCVPYPRSVVVLGVLVFLSYQAAAILSMCLGRSCLQRFITVSLPGSMVIISAPDSWYLVSRLALGVEWIIQTLNVPSCLLMAVSIAAWRAFCVTLLMWASCSWFAGSSPASVLASSS